MVWIIELASLEFYERDRAFAFKDLNKRKIWHHFVEKYEEKRNLTAEVILTQLREMLGIEKTPISKTYLLNDADTEFIKTIIRELAKKYNWNYSVTLERFYVSRVCGILSDAHVGLSAFTLEEILALFHQDLNPALQLQ
jgi:hypothetical protein